LFWPPPPRPPPEEEPVVGAAGDVVEPEPEPELEPDPELVPEQPAVTAATKASPTTAYVRVRAAMATALQGESSDRTVHSTDARERPVNALLAAG
jgi:hypothetical protein